MGTVLISLPKREDAERIASVLRERGSPHDIVVCSTAAEILRISNNRDYGVTVCSKSLGDMGYADLIGYLPDHFGMIVLTKDASLEILSDRMMRLLLPLRMSELRSAIDSIINGVFAKLRKKKKTGLKRTEQEQRIIDQAKQILMQKKMMSEPEAYRYIQKNSMDTGRSFVESAKIILLLNQNTD